MARHRKQFYESRGIDLRMQAYENMSKENLARAAAREAKSMNQRMRRLEKAGFGGEAPASRAFYVMRTEISRWFPGAKKFSEQRGVYEKMNVRRVKAILRELEYIKTLKTSTVPGTRAAMKNRQKGFEEKTGVKFESTEQFTRFWNSGVGKFLFELLGSDEALEMILHSPKDLDQIIEDVKRWKDLDNGDKDNADRIAEIMGYKDLSDARRHMEGLSGGNSWEILGGNAMKEQLYKESGVDPEQVKRKKGGKKRGTRKRK